MPGRRTSTKCPDSSPSICCAGPEREDHVLYASHSLWVDEAHFQAWTRSQQFREAHRNAGQNRGLYLGPPDFEGFTTIIAEGADIARA